MFTRFVWAALATARVLSMTSIRQVRRALQDLHSTVPLEAFFERLLDEIDSPEVHRVAAVLGLLACAMKPLTLAQTSEILVMNSGDASKIDFDDRLLDPNDVLAMCSSLVVTSRKTDQRNCQVEYVQLMHGSLEATLRSHTLPKRLSVFAVKPERHQFLACGLIHYLFEVFRDRDASEELLTEYPLTQYAAEHWPDHARLDTTEKTRTLSLHLIATERIYRNVLCIFNPDYPDQPPTLNVQNVDMLPALYYASLRGLRGVVIDCIAKGHDVNAQKCGAYDNALQAATVAHYPGIVLVLLTGRANPNLRGGTYGTPLFAAAFEDRPDIAQMLLEFGADVEAGGVNVSKTGHEQVFERLDEADARLSDGESKWSQQTPIDIAPIDSPLLAAAFAGNLATVKVLLDHKANPNRVDARFGRSSTMWAALRGHIEIVQLLISRGADIDIVDDQRSSALHLAIERRFDDIFNLLIEGGADLSLQNRANMTAADLAFQQSLKIDPKSYFTNEELTDNLSPGYSADRVEVLERQNLIEPHEVCALIPTSAQMVLTLCNRVNTATFFVRNSG